MKQVQQAAIAAKRYFQGVYKVMKVTECQHGVLVQMDGDRGLFVVLVVEGKVVSK